MTVDLSYPVNFACADFVAGRIFDEHKYSGDDRDIGRDDCSAGAIALAAGRFTRDQS